MRSSVRNLSVLQELESSPSGNKSLCLNNSGPSRQRDAL